MSGRFILRHGNGRYRRASLERDFGLTMDPECPNPDCRLLQPRRLGEPPAEKCHTCGTALPVPKRCEACLGNGYFDVDTGEPTLDCGGRKCLDCTGTGVTQ